MLLTQILEMLGISEETDIFQVSSWFRCFESLKM